MRLFKRKEQFTKKTYPDYLVDLPVTSADKSVNVKRSTDNAVKVGPFFRHQDLLVGVRDEFKIVECHGGNYITYT